MLSDNIPLTVRQTVLLSRVLKSRFRMPEAMQIFQPLRPPAIVPVAGCPDSHPRRNVDYTPRSRYTFSRCHETAHTRPRCPLLTKQVVIPAHQGAYLQLRILKDAKSWSCIFTFFCSKMSSLIQKVVRKKSGRYKRLPKNFFSRKSWVPTLLVFILDKTAELFQYCLGSCLHI